MEGELMLKATAIAILAAGMFTLGIGVSHTEPKVVYVPVHVPVINHLCPTEDSCGYYWTSPTDHGDKPVIP